MRTIILGLAAVSVLSACSGPAGDPFARAGTWNIEHDNDSNLAAMVADPDDLVHGRGTALASGQVAAAAVDRYRTGQIRPLPDSAVAEVKPVASTGPEAAAPAAGAIAQ